MKNGFIITSNMNREDKSFKEFKDKVQGVVASPSKNSVNSQSNFYQLLMEELKNLKIKDIFAVKEKYKSFLLIENRSSAEPTDILRKCRNKNIEFKNVLRIVPLDFLSKFDQKSVENFILAHPFEGSYKILFEGRLCPEDLKERMFQIIIPLIHGKVKLVNPDYVIIIQAFKNFIGISVMENDVKNFNFSAASSSIKT